jgi:hypothetical protein
MTSKMKITTWISVNCRYNVIISPLKNRGPAAIPKNLTGVGPRALLRFPSPKHQLLFGNLSRPLDYGKFFRLAYAALPFY